MRPKSKKSAALILIVDDDPLYVKFWRRLLAELSICNVQATTDPIEAKKILEDTRCDILISDVIMPHSNGYDLAKFAREKNPACKIILTTAYSPYLSKFDLIRPNFHLLLKPYGSIWELGKLIRKLAEGEENIDEMDEGAVVEEENKDYPEVVQWKV